MLVADAWSEDREYGRIRVVILEGPLEGWLGTSESLHVIDVECLP